MIVVVVPIVIRRHVRIKTHTFHVIRREGQNWIAVWWPTVGGRRRGSILL